MTFTTYIESWSSSPVNLVQDMIAKGAIHSRTRIVLAFASFNFDSTTYIPGLQNMTGADVQKFTALVKGAGGTVSLSIGGATYPFFGSDLYTRPGDLAANINGVLVAYGFDGVDFDIEDSYMNVGPDFASTAASLINTLRSLNGSLYISLTTPAQAWSAGMYQQTLLNMTIGNINAWQPMEYDLWIQSGSSYSSQIVWDINYYLTQWSVAPSKIVLGLMPGSDDMNHVLGLQDALALTTFATEKGLLGVMTWDADIDSLGVDGNAPYAYLMGMQAQLATLDAGLGGSDWCCIV